ncbi:MAG: hypothetical protein K8S55_02920, partial [Phycisphaerae bacterium]|nr:hypothetical protein [Phycisphaerae bacterium]
MYDIAILGATPAGYAAACRLAGAGRSVVVLNAPTDGDMTCPLCDWVPRDFFSLPGLPKTLATKSKALKFQKVRFHDTAVHRVVEHSARTPLGYFLPAGTAAKAMREAAVKAGATMRTTKTSPVIRLLEDHVELIGSRVIRARLLIVAQGHPAEVLSDLGLTPHVSLAASLSVIGLDIPLTPALQRTISKSLAGAMHVVQLPGKGDMGMCFLVRQRLHVRVISPFSAPGLGPDKLIALLKNFQQGGILPEKWSPGKATSAAWMPPAGVALEQEVHEAKRALLVGSAGGFADSVTGQALYPSVKSAMLAADIALAALAGDNPQDELMNFQNCWRESLADYLRPPNTSLAMLLPL